MDYQVIRDLNGEDYHHSMDYKEYVSSSQLKHYLVSPLHFKHECEKEQTSTEAMIFGNLFHFAMECFSEDPTGMKFLDNVKAFNPPINPKTGNPYGIGTQKYDLALMEFQMENVGNIVSDIVTLQQVFDMVKALTDSNTSTSQVVKKFMKWKKETETSYFLVTDDGVKLKVRPDLLTNGKLVDWKTTSSIDLSEKSIVRMIVNYRYDISLAMYQWVLHEISGVWHTPYLVVISKSEPYDSIVVDMSAWCYEYSHDYDMVAEGIGARDFQKLLALHKDCLSKNEWRGAELNITEDEKGNRIMRPRVPSWMDKWDGDSL